MAEPASQASDGSTPKLSAPKDKNCPYCGQAFTSSSLGRHLDLYIKEKNPKAPDGIHDVDAIRKMRGGITRRQPRGSIGARRDGSTPTGTPRPAPKRDSSGQETDGYRSPAMRRDGFATESNIKFTTPFQPTWEATGVMNDIPRKGNWEGEDAQEPNRRPGMQRTVSKQTIQKAQFDVKQKLADAMDTARAAELALRELVSSWRAAKLQIDNNSMPFDFDPLSLDFPALTLQCLQPPPTLFSSTQHPTSTSWSVQSPGQREFTALQAFFQEEFRTWKLSCASATTTAAEEFAYPPSTGPFRDVREAVRKAEKSAENLEAQVNEHLQSAYAVWDSLPAQRQQEVWVLELARSVGRKHKETEKMKQFQHKLKQENANLKSQIDQLNRLQQPREFKISPPVTVPMERELLNTLLEFGVQSGGKGVGFSLEDRHVDLGTIVSKSIERWKSVIASNRASVAGMNAQRSLDQSAQNTGFTTINGPAQAQQQKNQPQQQPAQISVSVVKTPQQPMQQQQLQQAQQAQQQKQQQQQQQQAQQQQMQPSKRLSNASTNGMTSEQATNSTNTTAPPSVEEEISDEDADAEMEDDDSFAIMNTSPVKAAQPMQQQATLEVPRTRGPVQQRNAADHRFMMPNGTGSPVGRASINLSRSMPNMNIAMQNAAAMQAADMTMAMQGVRGDPMYME